ncbi:hypothetical protein H6P81_004291 [Aristolochia fimbriata]|uniref:Uncharacterized protein n=1 Tax=Aristolochia fimbriata TaxID=158543 RepID=A0AAV7FHX6_ARIFI|nr:hypothetical protein H6P81_004291 [Aristolochia fimbriata]
MAARVHSEPLFAAPSTSSCMTSGRESFTIWMKSLVFNGRGCTVFDSRGEIVYRIDNYNQKHGDTVFLMDLRGRYKCEEGSTSTTTKEKPSFTVTGRPRWVLNRSGSPCCNATVRWDDQNQISSRYKIEAFKSGFKIVDPKGGLVAEVKQKCTSSGVALGDDVFRMGVEGNVDHSLIMAIVVVYSLMNHNM